MKSLIAVTTSPMGNSGPFERTISSMRVNKPCAFFQTRAGCRNGSRCPYLHDPSYKAPQEEFNRISAPAVRRP